MELIEHYVKIDENTHLTLNIPKELSAEELSALMTKANKIIKAIGFGIPLEFQKLNTQGSGGHFSSWTEKDEKILREKYPTTPTREVSVLIGRSEGAVSQRAKTLGIKKLYFGDGKQIAPQIEAPLMKGKGKEKSLIIKSAGSRTIWDLTMLRYLKQNYGKIKTKEIAEKFKLTGKQVADKVCHLRNADRW